MYRKTTRGHIITPHRRQICRPDTPCQCTPVFAAPENRLLRTRYLKSSADRYEQYDLENLQEIFSYISRRYTSGIRAVERTPEGMASRLEEYLRTFDKTLGADMAKATVKIDMKGVGPARVLEEIAPVFEQNISRLSNILYAHDMEIRSYLALDAPRNGDTYLYLSEQTETTCDLCGSLHGRLLSREEIQEGGVIPPLHPNCNCALVALDSAAGYMYLRRRGLPARGVAPSGGVRRNA